MTAVPCKSLSRPAADLACLTAATCQRKVYLVPKNLYIIDSHSHIYAAFYAPMRQRLTSPSGEPTKATYIFTTTLLGLLQRKKPDMLVVAFDSKEPSFRSEIYPEYKAHRPPVPDEMIPQIKRIEEILDAMNITSIRVAGYEADDIIGTLAKKAADDGIDVFICSKDKDMLQLLNEHIFVYDISTDKPFDSSDMLEKMKVPPEKFLDVLALQGDTVDNVPGIPDVGPKTALQWIRQYGSLENLLAHVDEIGGKRGRSLRQHKDDALLSRQLVTIDCNVPLRLSYDKFTVGDFDPNTLARLFTELGFTRLLSQLGLVDKAPPATGQTDKQTAAKNLAEPDSVKTTDHNYQLIDTPEEFDKFLKALTGQKLIAIDTETNSQYPMKADLVGLSFCWQKHTAFYLPLKAPMGAKHLPAELLRNKLGPILADANVKKIGQNIKFDLLVLRSAGLDVRGVFFDTMVASYCLDAERKSHSMDSLALDFLNYRCEPISSLIGKGKNQLTFDLVDTTAAAEYAAEDADITLQLYEYLNARLDAQPQLKKLFEEVEMPLVTVLAEMEYNGVTLDTAVLRSLSNQITKTLEEVSEKTYQLAGTVFNIDSPKQLGEVLFDRLNLPAVRTGKTGRSTDADVLEQLRGMHPIVDLISEYRQLSKLKNTYVDKLPALINPRTRRLHASFNQTVTATGRLSSSDPNLQNIPIRTDLGRKIRAAFVAQEKTGCILSADYSQIELRLLAHFSKDKTLMKAFAADMDIHRFVASQIFDVPMDKVTSDMRSKCKAVNFGIIYGQGPFGLARTTGLSQSEAKKFIDDYFNRYKSIRKFMDKVTETAARTGYAETILHRRRSIAGLASKNANKRSSARRMAVNTVIQGSAADLIKVAMVNIQRKIHTDRLPVKMILQIHDELVFELPAEQADFHADWISREMTAALSLDVPLKVDVTIGRTWLG